MACYHGYDFSESVANELFVEVGTNSGQPYYENETGGTWLYYYTDYDTYYIDNVVSNPPTNPVMYYNLTPGTDPEGTYEVSSGPAYAGYVELVSCGGGGATTTATSTDATTNDLMFMYAVIIFMIGFMFWGFVTNNLMDKNKHEY